MNKIFLILTAILLSACVASISPPIDKYPKSKFIITKKELYEFVNGKTFVNQKGRLITFKENGKIVRFDPKKNQTKLATWEVKETKDGIGYMKNNWGGKKPEILFVDSDYDFYVNEKIFSFKIYTNNPNDPKLTKEKE